MILGNLRRLARLAALVVAAAMAAGTPAPAATPDARAPATKLATGSHITRVHPGLAARIEAAGSRIEVAPGSVDAVTDIEVMALAARDLAALDQGMSLVTAGGGGYRFGPHGARFRKALTLALPYDPRRLPAGTTPDDVYAFYFDEDLERWVALDRVRVDPATHTVVSLTDHFTDIITATLVTPAHPEVESFVPTMLKDMKAADPGSGIELIQPPGPNPIGEARLSYPIELPSGRNRMQPSLALSYGSGSGNGWLGIGWSLPIPDVTVETRWGVPRYGLLPDAGGTVAYRNQETESYLMNGAALTPLAHVGAFEDRVGDRKVFHARVEGAFDAIVRHGSGPASFWWEVHDRNGVRSIYGEPPEAGPTAGTLRTAGNDIFRWALREVRDLHGNAMRFEYERVSDAGVEGGSIAGEQLYLAAINYAGRVTPGGGYEPGPYTVRFIRDSHPSLGPWVRRRDVLIDCRGGFKQVTAERLRRIRVELDGELVRQYDLDYEEGAFGKTRLAAIRLRGADGVPVAGAEHRFAYHDEVRDASGAYAAGFAPEDPWSVPFDDVTLCKDLGPIDVCPSTIVTGFDRASAMSGTVTHSFTGHLYLGFSCAVPSKGFSIGGKVGFDHSRTDGHLALLDVTGDNLPDKVFRSGSGFVYRENLARPGGSRAFSGAATPLPSLEALSSETSTSLNGGAEANYGVGVLANVATAISVSTVYSTDANGDGFADVVNGGQVQFGRPGPDGTPLFEPSSAGTPVPLGAGSVDGEGLIQDYEPLFQDQIDQYPLQDVFRRWWVPYDGFVRIQGGVRLEAPAASEDGVRVSIQHNGTVLWAARIPAGDAMTHEPLGLDRVRVERGDRLYFRVQSVFEGSGDAVAWDPEIQYLDVAPSPDANGFDGHRYRASEDFVLFGRAGRTTVSQAGPVRVIGVFEKRDTTSDDVTVSVRRNDEEMFRATMPWDSTGQVVLDVPFSVTADDTATHEVNEADYLYVQLISDSPIDPRRIGWRSDAPPELVYESALFQAIRANGGQAAARTFLPYDLDLYPADTLAAPQEAWEAPHDGTISVSTMLGGEWSFRELGVEGPVRDGALAFTVKRRGARLAHTTITVQDRAATNVTVDGIEVAQGDRIFFDVSMRNASARGTVGARVRYASLPLPAADVPCVLHANIDFDDVPMLGRGLYPQPHRGWSGAAYNGNPPRDDPERPHACSGSREGSTAAIVETDLVMPESAAQMLARKDVEGLGGAIESQRAYAFSPMHEVLDDGTLRASWRGDDDSGWIQAGSVSATRYGVDLVGVPCASDLAGGGDGRRALPRIGTSLSGGAGVGRPPFAVGGSFGHSRNETDFLDLNGDRFPDNVGIGRAQFTLPDGGLELRNRDLGSSLLEAVRASNNAAVTIGGTIPRTFGGSRGTAGANNESSPKGEDTRNLMLSVGFGGDLSAGSSTVRYDLIDMNGDGLPDRVSHDGTVALNLGYGFADPETWPGLAGLDQSHSCEGSLGVGLGVNDGIYGFAGGLSYSQARSRTHRSLVDLNGDGLPDLLRHERNLCLIDIGQEALWVAFNTGNGFGPETLWQGAGFEAISKTVNASLGAGLFFSVAIPVFMCSPVTPIFLIINPGGGASAGMARQEVALLDVDGDGCVDMVRSTRDDEMIVARNRTGRTNLLKRVDRPLGGAFALDYEREGNTVDLPQSTWVLARVEVFDGFADDGPSPLLTTFAYQSPRYDRAEREFYGFGEVVEEHRAADAPGQVYRSVARTYLNDSYYGKGLMTREETRDAAGRPIRLAAFDYAFRDAATSLPADPGSRSAAIAPTLSRETRQLAEGAGGAGVASRRLYTHDALGNVIRVVDEGEAGAGDDVETTITYAECPGGLVRSSPTGIVVRSGQATLAERQATVDCATGDVLQIRQRLADGAEAVTDLTYTPSGALESVTGPANLAGQRYVLRYEYDARLATYVTQVEDSFGLTSFATHDPRFGRPVSTTDVNGHVMTFAHDAIGRITGITGPYEQGLGGPTLTFEYHPEAPVPWARTGHLDALRKDPLETVLFTDGLGRILQTKVDGTVHTAPETPAQDVMIVSGRRRYDAFGRVAEEYQSITEPLGQGPLFNPAFDAAPPSRTEYDALDRPVVITTPDQATTRYRHALNVDRDGVLRQETTVIDANGRERRLYRDAQDRLTAVREGGAEMIWTSYRYDALDRLVSIMDARGHMTRMEYDALGRRTALVRPDAGTTRYEYDPAGNLVALRTANLLARGQAIRYEHEFSRLSAVRYPNPARDVTYEYGGPGAPDNGVGRVIRITDEGGVEERAYGPLGELVQVSRRLGRDDDDDDHDKREDRTPRTYTTRYRYDTFGRMLGMTYPDGEVLTYEYDSGGLVRRITGDGPQGPYEYLRRLEHDASLQQAYLELGNGVATRFTYRAEDERLERLESRNAAGVFQNLRFDYDAVGNVRSVANEVAVPSRGPGGPTLQQFTYDELDRLTRATGARELARGARDEYVLDVGYDAIHNIREKRQRHERVKGPGRRTLQRGTSHHDIYRYSPKQPHAAIQVGEREYSFDANGNQTGWEDEEGESGRRNTWDEENRLRSVTGRGPKVRFTYDAAGTRLLKRGPGSEIAYVNQFFTVKNDRIATRHIYVGTTRIASRVIRPPDDDDDERSHARARDLYFLHPDHLGSTQFVTDANGEVIQHLEYFPFGEIWVDERRGSAPSDLAFSGKELDEETGLYYFGARYQDPRLGQFLSVDPTSSGAGEALGEEVPASLNGYAYAFNNPVRMVVPGGLRPQWWSSLSHTLGRFSGTAGPSVAGGVPMMPPEIGNSDSPVHASVARKAAEIADERARRPDRPASQTRPRSNAIAFSTRERSNAVSGPSTRARANALLPTRERSNAVFGEGPSAYLDGPAPVVLGENMTGRVTPFARGIGAETIVDWLGGRSWTQQLNDAYIAFLKAEGRRIVDIGPDFNRRLQFKLNPPTDRSARPVYESERQNLLEGGPADYRMKFERRGRYEGGVRGFDIMGRRDGGAAGLN